MTAAAASSKPTTSPVGVAVIEWAESMNREPSFHSVPSSNVSSSAATQRSGHEDNTLDDADAERISGVPDNVIIGSQRSDREPYVSTANE